MSVQEVTKHTDINVTYDTNRQGRKVVEIIFVVERKEVFQLYLDFDNERLDHVERLEDARAAKGGSDLQSLLEHYGVGERKAKELIARYEEDRIRGNIEKPRGLSGEGHPGRLPRYSRAGSEDLERSRCTELSDSDNSGKQAARCWRNNGELSAAPSRSSGK